MPHPESVLADIVNLWRRVENERQRAVRAGALAAKYEAEPGPEYLREFRATIAALQRRVEARHLAAAKMHELHAIRMERWLQNPGTLRPLFMAAVATTLGINGATATVRGREHPMAAVAASDEVARAAHDLEVILGEGPAATVMAEGAPVRAAGPTLLDRWPRYGAAVADLGVRAVIAAPLRIPTGCLGALCGYDREPAIKDDVAAVTERIADALTHTILSSAADESPVVVDDGFPAVFNQAIGMISVYRECRVEDAEALLRARAFADNRSLREVALDVVEGRTRLG